MVAVKLKKNAKEIKFGMVKIAYVNMGMSEMVITARK